MGIFGMRILGSRLARLARFARWTGEVASPYVALRVQDGFTFALQRSHDFFGIFRLDANFFEGSAEVVEEQVEVGMAEALLPHRSVRGADLLARVDTPAEEHGNQHDLAGAQRRHVRLRKEMAEGVVFENSFIEAFGRSFDGGLSADQFV